MGSFKTSREHTMITLCSFELVYEDIFAIIAVDVPRHPHSSSTEQLEPRQMQMGKMKDGMQRKGG